MLGRALFNKLGEQETIESLDTRLVVTDDVIVSRPCRHEELSLHVKKGSPCQSWKTKPLTDSLVTNFTGTENTIKGFFARHLDKKNSWSDCYI